ncbi:MAG: DUF4175 family protein [Pseudomonadota bacterium]
MADLRTIPGVKGRIRQTRARLLRLAALEAAGFALLFLAIYAFFAVLGGLERLPVVWQAGLSLAFLGGLAVLGVRAWRRFRVPAEGDAVVALDAQSDLRPLSSLADRPVTADPGSRGLWDAHAARLAEAAADLRTPRFRDRWRAVDPFYLRFGAPLVLGAAIAVTWNQAPSRLQQAFAPDLGALLGAQNLRVEAWITPPAYSGRAPLFLDADTSSVRVPAGSEVTLRAFGRSAPRLRVDSGTGRADRRFQAMPDGAFEATAVIEADSDISVRWWGERAGWSILASPDDAPAARFVETPTVTPQDRTAFSWEASDDYGVDALFLVLRPQRPHAAAPDEEARIPVPLPGIGEREIGEDTELDLTRHKWAGLDVRARLVAVDGAGQEGASDAVDIVLPEKLFLQPLAKAAQEIRVTVLRDPGAYDEMATSTDALRPGAINVSATQRLEMAPDGVKTAAIMLDAITYEAPRYFDDPSVYFGLRTARGILASAPDKAEADSVDPLLWAVAMKAEYGSAADALRALMAAKKALEQALRNGASEDQIRRLMEAFREAANNYVAAKMAEAIANGMPDAPMTEDGEASGGQGMGSNDFEDMLNALEDLAETGASDQARQLLSDITNMLENLEFQQGGSGGEGGWPGMPGQSADGEAGEDAPEEEQELTGALERLSELLREQRELNDDTLEAERDELDQRQLGQGPDGGTPSPGEPGAEPGASSLAERQDELGSLADRFAEALENGELGAAGEPGEAGEGGGPEPGGEEAFADFDGLGDQAEDTLGRIARTQRRAADALADGDLGRARRLQDSATRALRDLSSELAGALDELVEAREGDGSEAENTDPFGNPVGGVNDGDNVAIPEEADRQRAKDILDELRRRYDRAEDEGEREYLQRLLDRF